MSADFQAVIFDLDGVIINSEELHARAKRRTLDRFDIQYPESIFNDFKGRPDLDFWSFVVHELTRDTFSVSCLDGYKRIVYISLADEISLIPGVMEFLTKVRAAFPRLALVSSATLPDFTVADQKFNIRPWFDQVVLGEDTDLHKPNPDPYLMALSRLGTKAPAVIVIEDSPNGVRSAKAAGCYVMGIATGFTTSELLTAGADQVAHTFEGLAHLINQVHPAGRK
jgi:beta-phosphoglucomutase